MMNGAQRRHLRQEQSLRARRNANSRAGLNVIQRHQPIGDNAAHNLLLAESAFRDLVAGSADHELFERLAMALNCSLIRAEAIDPLLEQTMVAAVHAMNEAQEIFARHGRYGFTGPGLTAVGDALAAYEAIARESTPQQMQEALRIVLARYAAQKAAE